MNEASRHSAFDSSNIPFVEALYEQFLDDPTSVTDDWRSYFDGLGSGKGTNGGYISHTDVQREIIQHIRYDRPDFSGNGAASSSDDAEYMAKQGSVLSLINAYRLYGHMRADIDPLGMMKLQRVEVLDLSYHGLTQGDTGRLFHTGTMPAPDLLPLHEILSRLENTYCSSIGVEFMHLPNEEEKAFIQERVEKTQCDPSYSVEEKKNILRLLTGAEGMETYLHKKFVGQKRFSIEGGEALIPMMDEVIQRAGEQGAKEIVIGMAHRGRLNVLVNVMGKSTKELIDEFEHGAKLLGDRMTGDVKYHAGFSSDVSTPGGPMHLVLAYNPSHLEIINPVVEGSVRARQDRRGGDSTAKRREVVPILIHGDAAIAGQGVVYETLALSQTRGYGTGGSVHIVVNNQIGFTTSNTDDSRSSTYCTDVGKVSSSPIFHVNGDDPEACVFAMQLAIDFRMAFGRDVFVDLVCYRRHGHNEADAPRATQPRMYKAITNITTTLTKYRDALIREGSVSESEAQQMADDYRDALDDGLEVHQNLMPDYQYPHLSDWAQHADGHWSEPAKTGVPVKTLIKLGERVVDVPDDITLHPTVRKIYDDRAKMVQGEIPMDWGCAESLAYATLLNDGYPVRMTGQDICRGTFFHRHAVVHDMTTGKMHTPLKHVRPTQPNYCIHDSVLSESAVLGFEYGYSATMPRTLVIWEAQYGDFVNNAQVVIDQFISSSEQKWNMLSGLVMLLPHGWEGQGPEHSSARLERFLQLCAQENMMVAVPSTPAQMFHLLRRQMLRKVRMPLIVMSPKSMLRMKDSFVDIAELAKGEWQYVIPDPNEDIDIENVTRVSICSGRVYYNLARMRAEKKVENVALVRLEQLYPFPDLEVAAEFNKYPNLNEVFWTQEEPRNQGAWYQIDHQLRRVLPEGVSLRYAGRIPCSAPAGGSKERHKKREKLLLEASLGLRNDLTGEESTKRTRPDYR